MKGALSTEMQDPAGLSLRPSLDRSRVGSVETPRRPAAVWPPQTCRSPPPPPRSPFLALTALSPLCSLPTFSLRCGLVFSFQGIFCMEECFQCAEALIAKSWLPKHVILASSWYRAGGVFPSWRRRKKKTTTRTFFSSPGASKDKGLRPPWPIQQSVRVTPLQSDS